MYWLKTMNMEDLKSWQFYYRSQMLKHKKISASKGNIMLTFSGNNWDKKDLFIYLLLEKHLSQIDK